MKRELCTACPRQCRADREHGNGFCGVGARPRIARVGLHLWEEPCISYGAGSGTVFFSGCNLGCVFCQNEEISHRKKGKDIDPDTLAAELIALRNQGAANINLVTPSHYTECLRDVLTQVRAQLDIPIIYNSSGYDSVASLARLEGLIDIYLPDMKYYSSALSAEYSAAANYFSAAEKALEEMYRQVGYAQFDAQGHMRSGVLTRHLVLPGCYRDSIALLNHLAERYDSARFAISLMCQYFPAGKAAQYPQLNRRLTSFEYKKVVEHARALGFATGFIQQRESASPDYIPDFDYGSAT